MTHAHKFAAALTAAIKARGAQHHTTIENIPREAFERISALETGIADHEQRLLILEGLPAEPPPAVPYEDGARVTTIKELLARAGNEPPVPSRQPATATPPPTPATPPVAGDPLLQAGQLDPIAHQIRYEIAVRGRNNDGEALMMLHSEAAARGTTIAILIDIILLERATREKAVMRAFADLARNGGTP